jgi:hypothetical protein
MIANTTLSQIIMRNTNTTNLRPNVFLDAGVTEPAPPRR